MLEISQLKGTLHKGEAGRVYITSDNYMCLKQGTLRALSSATDCRHITEGKHAPPSLSRTACKPQQPKPVVTLGKKKKYPHVLLHLRHLKYIEKNTVHKPGYVKHVCLHWCVHAGSREKKSRSLCDVYLNHQHVCGLF